MLFCASIENQTLLFGIFSGERLLHAAELAVEPNATDFDYAVRLRNILVLWQIAAKEITAAAVASVVPAVTAPFCRACTLLFGVEPLVVGAGVRTGLKIPKYAKTLGADFVCNAVAAGKEYPLPLVLVSVGTATTFAALDAGGAFLGTAIAAGPKTSAEALHQEAAQLPFVGLEAPHALIAADTAGALESGLCFGHAAMVDGMARKFAQQLGDSCTFVLTGEHAAWLAGYCELPFLVDQRLALKGLRLIAQKNLA